LNGAPVDQRLATIFPAINNLNFGLSRSAAFDGYVRRLRYFNRALGPLSLIDLTAPAPVSLVRTLTWTANRPLIPGEIVRIPYRWNTSN
jgi:hypothetical protein